MLTAYREMLKIYKCWLIPDFYVLQGHTSFYSVRPSYSLATVSDINVIKLWWQCITLLSFTMLASAICLIVALFTPLLSVQADHHYLTHEFTKLNTSNIM